MASKKRKRKAKRRSAQVSLDRFAAANVLRAERLEMWDALTCDRRFWERIFRMNQHGPSPRYRKPVSAGSQMHWDWQRTRVRTTAMIARRDGVDFDCKRNTREMIPKKLRAVKTTKVAAKVAVEMSPDNYAGNALAEARRQLYVTG